MLIVKFILNILLLLIANNSFISNGSSIIEQKPLERVIKKEGWQLEELNTIDKARAPQSQRIIISNHEIDKVDYALIGNPLISLESYSTDGDSLLISKGKFYVKNLYSYKLIDGKSIFAYDIILIPAITDTRGIRENVGGLVAIRYYDGDGDGKFETMAYEYGQVRIPSWVK